MESINTISILQGLTPILFDIVADITIYLYELFLNFVQTYIA